MSRIVDTSVVVKWAVLEEDSEQALELLGSALIAPDLLKAELANALWKKVRRGQATPLQATAGFAAATSAVTFAPVSDLAGRALEIALELSHPVYDCFFLALAEAIGKELITADTRLIASCSNTSWANRLVPLRIAGPNNV